MCAYNCKIHFDLEHFTEWSNLTFDQSAYSVAEGETVDVVIVMCQGTMITDNVVVSVIAGDGGTAGNRHILLLTYIMCCDCIINANSKHVLSHSEW